MLTLENLMPRLSHGWALIETRSIRFGLQKERLVLGPKSPRRCIFCNCGSTKVTFKKDAHVIPAGLGNKSLFSAQECDNCNARAGETVETDLCNYLAPVRPIAFAPARSGMPKIKPKGTDYIKANREDRLVSIRAHESNSGVKVTDDWLHNLELEVDCPKFSPANVTRAIARIGYFIANQHSECRVLKNWCLGTDPWVTTLMSTIYFPELHFDGAMIAVQKSESVVPGSSVLRLDFMLGSFLTSFGISNAATPIPESTALHSVDQQLHGTVKKNSKTRRITGEDFVTDQSMIMSISYANKERVS